MNNNYVKQLEEEIAALKGKLEECVWKAELFDRIMTSVSIKNDALLDFAKSIELEMSCDTDNRLDRTIIEIAQKATEERKKWWDGLRGKQEYNKLNSGVEKLKQIILQEPIHKDIL